ncbi:MAG: hypothetical protein JWP55_2160 [Mycobacterium sp.]|nr:hypothetical protein [Mycobacterium sp.]
MGLGTLGAIGTTALIDDLASATADRIHASVKFWAPEVASKIPAGNPPPRRHAS